MVQEAFNPYRDWLGFQGASPPGNYYELLGVSAFESDPAVIAHRAEMASSRVRGVQPGSRFAEWQSMLSTIRAYWAGAKQTLLRMFIVMVSVTAVVVPVGVA